MMYMIIIMAVTLRNVDNDEGFWHVGSGHEGLQLVASCCSSSICHKDGASQFSGLRINGRACNAFRVCRARVATCGLNSAVDTLHHGFTHCGQLKTWWFKFQCYIFPSKYRTGYSAPFMTIVYIAVNQCMLTAFQL